MPQKYTILDSHAGETDAQLSSTNPRLAPSSGKSAPKIIRSSYPSAGKFGKVSNPALPPVKE